MRRAVVLVAVAVLAYLAGYAKSPQRRELDALRLLNADLDMANLALRAERELLLDSIAYLRTELREGICLARSNSQRSR